MRKNRQIEASKTCRICLIKAESLVNVFTEADNSATIAETLEKITNIQINKDSDYNLICSVCLQNLILAEKFITQAEKADTYLKEQDDLTESVIKSDNNDTYDAPDTPCIPSEIEEELEVKVFPILPDENGLEAQKIKEKKQIFGCCICKEVSYEDEESLWKHVEEIHPKRLSGTSTPNKKVQCDVCLRFFFSEHRIKVHKQDVLRPFYYCTICGKKYHSEFKVRNHEATHDPNHRKQRIECAHCGVLLADKSTMIKHYFRQHTVGNHVACDLCDEKFKDYVKLSYHRRSIHFNRYYECTECPMKFPKPTSLKIHMRKHTNSRPFACQYCDRRYNHKIDLKRHSYSHKSECEMPYKCPNCNKGFVKKSLLDTHLNTHKTTLIY